MKKTLLSVLALLSVTLTNAQLANGETFEDGIYKYIVSTPVVEEATTAPGAKTAASPYTVTLNGVVDGATIPADVEIPASVTKDEIVYDIKLIGGKVFKNNATITSLVIQGNTAFDSQAFRNCKSLKTIDLPIATSIGGPAAEEGGNETGLIFWQCSALETINMPKMENIYTGAFNSCAALTSITFPKTMTYISNANWNMFKGCTKLTEVIVEYKTFIPLTYNTDPDNENKAIFGDVAANATLKVPAQAEYLTGDVWKDFSSIVEDPSLSINSAKRIDVGSYTNPVVDYLEFSSNDVDSVEIYNITGAKVGSQKVGNGVDMSQLSSGVYFVKAKSIEGTDFETIRIIKE